MAQKLKDLDSPSDVGKIDGLSFMLKTVDINPIKSLEDISNEASAKLGIPVEVVDVIRYNRHAKNYHSMITGEEVPPFFRNYKYDHKGYAYMQVNTKPPNIDSSENNMYSTYIVLKDAS